MQESAYLIDRTELAKVCVRLAVNCDMHDSSTVRVDDNIMKIATLIPLEDRPTLLVGYGKDNLDKYTKFTSDMQSSITLEMQKRKQFVPICASLYKTGMPFNSAVDITLIMLDLKMIPWVLKLDEFKASVYSGFRLLSFDNDYDKREKLRKAKLLVVKTLGIHPLKFWMNKTT